MSDDVGNLRHSVTLNRASAYAQSDSGEPSATKAAWKTCRAEITTLAGRELEIARGYAATAAVRVRIRYQAAILDQGPTIAVAFGTRRFSVQAVIDPKGTKRWLHLYCTETTPTAVA
jgi:SPP1 family predicted phage head-tail adaptor